MYDPLNEGIARTEISERRRQAAEARLAARFPHPRRHGFSRRRRRDPGPDS